MSTPVTIEDIYKIFQKSQEEFDRRMAESDRRMAETERLAAEAKAETERLAAESDRRIAEAKAETERLAAESDRRIAEAKAETERLAAESDRRIAEAKAETERLAAEAKQRADKDEAERKRIAAENEADDLRRKREFDQQMKELGKQIGGLGAKFGSFTEGLALPSMQKILGDRFGMEVISPSVRVSKLGQHLEIDVLAYANSNINQAYVVEVKSHPREDSITQLKAILNKFRDFFPEHKDKQVYGIIAAVDLPENLKVDIHPALK